MQRLYPGAEATTTEQCRLLRFSTLHQFVRHHQGDCSGCCFCQDSTQSLSQLPAILIQLVLAKKTETNSKLAMKTPPQHPGSETHSAPLGTLSKSKTHETPCQLVTELNSHAAQGRLVSARAQGRHSHVWFSAPQLYIEKGPRCIVSSNHECVSVFRTRRPHHAGCW